MTKRNRRSERAGRRNVNVGVTPLTEFFTRSTACPNTGVDAYVRLEFQDVTSGPFGPSDYWWSTGNTWNLSTIANVSTILSLSTTDAAAWTNINGQNGLDDPAGFATAMKNVKQVGLAFGSSCRYASGVNVANGSGRFDMTNFTITP